MQTMQAWTWEMMCQNLLKILAYRNSNSRVILDLITCNIIEFEKKKGFT